MATTPANAVNITGAGAVTFDGTATFSSIAPGTSGNVLTSNGSVWTSAAPTSSVSVGDIITQVYQGMGG